MLAEGPRVSAATPLSKPNWFYALFQEAVQRGDVMDRFYCNIHGTYFDEDDSCCPSCQDEWVEVEEEDED